jgi:hypothetical protein
VHGVPHCPTPRALAEAFQQAWEKGLDVGAVFVVSPTYFGVAGKLAGRARDRGGESWQEGRGGAGGEGQGELAGRCRGRGKLAGGGYVAQKGAV